MSRSPCPDGNTSQRATFFPDKEQPDFFNTSQLDYSSNHSFPSWSSVFKKLGPEPASFTGVNVQSAYRSVKFNQCLTDFCNCLLQRVTAWWFQSKGTVVWPWPALIPILWLFVHITVDWSKDHPSELGSVESRGLSYRSLCLWKILWETAEKEEVLLQERYWWRCSERMPAGLSAGPGQSILMASFKMLPLVSQLEHIVPSRKCPAWPSLSCLPSSQPCLHLPLESNNNMGLWSASHSPPPPSSSTCHSSCLPFALLRSECWLGAMTGTSAALCKARKKVKWGIKRGRATKATHKMRWCIWAYDWSRPRAPAICSSASVGQKSISAPNKLTSYDQFQLFRN